MKTVITGIGQFEKTITTNSPKKFRFEYKPTMLMSEFVEANYAYYEAKFVEDYPMKFVWDEDLDSMTECFAKEVRETMIDLYSEQLQ